MARQIDADRLIRILKNFSRHLRNRWCFTAAKAIDSVIKFVDGGALDVSNDS